MNAVKTESELEHSGSMHTYHARQRYCVRISVPSSYGLILGKVFTANASDHLPVSLLATLWYTFAAPIDRHDIFFGNDRSVNSKWV
jgi:hypothetical protein